MAADKKDIEQAIADVITGRPKGFTAGNRHFFLWPVTLGKLYLIQRIMGELNVDNENLKINPYAEALRVVKNHKEDVLLLLCYLTYPNTVETSTKIWSQHNNTEKINYLRKHLDDNDLATLLIVCLTWDNTEEIVRYLRIDKEAKRLKDISKVKKDNNTFSFGGVSIFGTLYGTLVDSQTGMIDWKNEQYLTWVIPYTKVQLILRDSVKTIYLTDEERKKAHVTNDNVRINGDDKAQMMQLINSGYFNE